VATGVAKPGQTIVMPGGWDATVVGIYSDYGNQKGQVIIGIDALVAHFPDISKLRYVIRVPPESAPNLQQKLISEFGLVVAAVALLFVPWCKRSHMISRGARYEFLLRVRARRR
jgi:hypothetical protein